MRPVDGGQTAPVTIVTLPAPPSVNNLWQVVRAAGGSRLAQTDTYQRWKAEADWSLRAQIAAGAKPIAGNVLAIVGVDRRNLRADIDNTVKALFDRLVAAGLIEDDNKVTGFANAWQPPGSGLAQIAITPVRPLTISFHPANSLGALGGWIFDAPPTEGEPPWL